jgi:hypothetical protein
VWFFPLTKLPVASTFWRYLDSLGINQAQSLLKLMSIPRKGMRHQAHHYRICIDIDTTVETIYGNQQRPKAQHQNRGKGYRRCCASLSRPGMLIESFGRRNDQRQAPPFILQTKSQLPACVQKACYGQMEFQSWEALAAHLRLRLHHRQQEMRSTFDPDGCIGRGKARTLNTTVARISLSAKARAVCGHAHTGAKLARPASAMRSL